MKNNNKILQNTISENRNKFLRVIVANEDLKIGMRINEKNTAIKRVNDNQKGIFPEKYRLVLNKKLKVNIKKDQLIQKNFIE